LSAILYFDVGESMSIGMLDFSSVRCYFK